MMSIPGIPAGGLKTVGQIVGTNGLRFHAAQNGLAIAAEILSSHISGAPVIDDEGKFIGFISEFDVLGRSSLESTWIKPRLERL
jgi:CBS domain-containing protein